MAAKACLETVTSAAHRAPATAPAGAVAWAMAMAAAVAFRAAVEEEVVPTTTALAGRERTARLSSPTHQKPCPNPAHSPCSQPVGSALLDMVGGDEEEGDTHKP